MMKKIIIIAFAIMLFLVVIFLMAKEFSPGSYNGVMRFKIEIPESQAIVKIDSIKKSNNSDRYLMERDYVDGRKGENWTS